MTRRLFALALAALVSGGCGTVTNLALFNPEEGGKRVYGGVRADWVGITGIPSATPSAAPDSEDRFVQTLLALDMPVSAFWDTLTLPITVPHALGWIKSGPTKPATSSAPASNTIPGAPPPASDIGR